MQLVENGPDIPTNLLFEHEQGNVVFFCGAGVSMPAGLPNFRTLVERLYRELEGAEGPLANHPDELQAFDAGQYDRVIGLLEKRRQGGRQEVRNKLLDILSEGSEVLNTHANLLRLSRDKSSITRLITTNFDRLFVKAMDTDALLGTEVFSAPHLPIPKVGRWDGLVHLHGILPLKNSMTNNERALNELVLSSGDFGRAYLTERWASRFLAELFRRYTVCFIGYSIDDPVLRYITDALQVDQDQGEEIKPTYAFVGTDDDLTIKPEWKQKHVELIPYRERSDPESDPDHAVLYETIEQWANNYRDGTTAKKQIIGMHAEQDPDAIHFGVAVKERVLWALRDNGAAKAFAEQDPPYGIEWLKTLSEPSMGYDDLLSFGVSPDLPELRQEDMKFSFMSRPTANLENQSYRHAQWTRILELGAGAATIDFRMRCICQWLAKHVHDPELILWIVSNGGRIGPDFRRILHNRFEETSDDSTTIWDGISPGMQSAWNLIMNDRVRYKNEASFEWYEWTNTLELTETIIPLRGQLHDLLSTCVLLSKKTNWHDKVNAQHGAESAENLVDLFEVKFSTSGELTEVSLDDLRKNPTWQLALSDLLADTTMLLREMMDMQRLAGRVGDSFDFSYIDRPSITDHKQNRDFVDNGAILIVLARDAMIATAKKDKARARRMVDEWWAQPYPVFKRLVFFACTINGLISPSRAVKYLLDEDAKWLWSNYCRRESLRLLVHLAPKVKGVALGKLQDTLFQTPVFPEWSNTMSEEEKQKYLDHTSWRSLKKFSVAGGDLGSRAEERLSELETQYSWELQGDERDEFPYYSMDHDEIQAEKIKTLIPHKPDEMKKYLIENPNIERDFRREDDWSEVCHELGETAFQVLLDIGSEEMSKERWCKALYVWSNQNGETIEAEPVEDKAAQSARSIEESEGQENAPSWPKIVEKLVSMPDEGLLQIAHPLTHNLKHLVAQFNGKDDLLFGFIDRILALTFDDSIADDIFTQAINHPVGCVTEAMMEWWFDQKLKRNAGLPTQLSDRLETIINGSGSGMIFGKTILGLQAGNLFLGDNGWTRRHLLPLFDWQQEQTATALWQGYLRPSSIIMDMMQGLKPYLMETAEHLDKLGEARERFPQYMAVIVLSKIGLFNDDEKRTMLQKFKENDLVECLSTIINEFKGAGDRRREYWENRASSFVRLIIAVDNTRSQDLSFQYAKLLTRAGPAFPEVYDAVKSQLQQLKNPQRLIMYLAGEQQGDGNSDRDLVQYNAQKFLEFLDKIIDPNLQWASQKFWRQLDAMLTDERFNGLAESPTFSKLKNLCADNLSNG